MKFLLNMEKAMNIICNFQNKSLMIVGDLMLDRYIWGRVSRISPEAPVPVVEVIRDTLCLGGAANVVNNVRGLGGKPIICGIIGDDSTGEDLINEIKKLKVNTDGIFKHTEKPTTLKTRIIAHNQQVVRFDREEVSDISEKILSKILSFVSDKIADIDGIIISDYGKGVITSKVLKGIIQVARRNNKIVLVDPKINHFFLYQGVTAITPNQNEAETAAGHTIRTEDDLILVGNKLLKSLNCDSVLITRGEHGMTLFESRGDMLHIPTFAKEVYDVTGAGDTVISSLTLSLAAGANMQEASIISNFAAGIVVGKVGTSVVYFEELKKVILSTKNNEYLV